MSLLKKFAPKEFRPFLNHIGPSAFKVIDWKGALKSSKTITSRMMSNEGREQLKSTLQLPDGMTFSEEKAEQIELSDNKQFGEKLLELYFSQLRQNKGTFLDLRARTFSKRDADLLWSPSNLWIEWDAEFVSGLNMVYEGFYGDKPDLMDEGLVKMKLVNESMEASTREEIRQLLIDHVGSESPEKTSFELEKFEASFEQFFQILKKNNMRLPADFLFLGVYLVTLYSSLEEVGCELNVKSAYLNTQPAN